MKYGFSLLLFAAAASAQPLRTLKGVPVPGPPTLDTYVQDRTILIALGKMFFWDMQAGSDGRMACATCHFHAGADHRPQNQISDPLQPFPLNQPLALVSFPLRLLGDVTNRNSAVVRDATFRVASAGMFRRVFGDVVPGSAAEIGEDKLDVTAFVMGDLQLRRVTARNTPSSINAVFYRTGFWDGRANRFFNGFTPSADAADAPGILASAEGRLTRETVRLDNSSLASQAVGPLLDHLEMSYAGRTWPKVGKKLLSLSPLAYQKVSPDDSVLGAMARIGERGLLDEISYLSLVRKAFQPRLWDSGQLVDATGAPIEGRIGAPVTTSEFTQAEYNFSLFWGLALQAYQATLVSDDAPLDRFLAGDSSALTPQEQEGMRFYQAQGRCTNCHGGPELSAAVAGGGRAFQRTGVRPAAEDAGAGNGSFKSIGLRNIELTGPYFHNGGQSTLEQVVEFYARGGDFTPGNDIRSFAMTPGQKAALVAFLKALTDNRVRLQQAPFDHPELCIPIGHTESAPGVLFPGPQPAFASSAAERWAAVPETGASGALVPLRTFEELLQGMGDDRSRANPLGAACSAPLPDGPVY